ncbi:uncharacterized protein LOC128208441 [Mya arenaria]|uniref:uncharacterized protein LOC128208441 n=1 Tax=Mya arenaria TaxID=6604 RepID=UPI0022E2EFC1|nr:uncharacterized protein LOC128208441 [Mya arenaria]
MAVRAGLDVFVIDYKTPEIDFKSCKSGLLHRKVKQIGNKDYEIVLPTGTKVKAVQTRQSGEWDRFMEVDIYPGLPDKGSVDGLCGNFDGNSENDVEISSTPIIASFYPIKESSLQKYTVNATMDLFNPNIYEGLTDINSQVKFCECGEENLISAQKGHFEDTKILCKADTKNTCVEDGSVDFHTCAVARKKRSIDRHLSANTKLGATNEITSSTAWARIHIEAIKETCVEHVKFNQPIPPEVFRNVTATPKEWFTNTTNQTEINETGKPTTTPTPVPAYTPLFSVDVLETIASVACPGDCNGHGDCVKGKCNCSAGFFDIDCGLDIRQPPIISGIPDMGLCDVHQRDCAMTSILGRKFVNSKNLTCKFKSFQVRENSSFLYADHFITIPGELATSVEVSCILPTIRRKRFDSDKDTGEHIATGYNVSISNDGLAFSDEDSFIVYDSTCVTCSPTAIGQISCSMKVPMRKYAQTLKLMFSRRNSILEKA